MSFSVIVLPQAERDIEQILVWLHSRSLLHIRGSGQRILPPDSLELPRESAG